MDDALHVSLPAVRAWHSYGLRPVSPRMYAESVCFDMSVAFRVVFLATGLRIPDPLEERVETLPWSDSRPNLMRPSRVSFELSHDPPPSLFTEQPLETRKLVIEIDLASITATVEDSLVVLNGERGFTLRTLLSHFRGQPDNPVSLWLEELLALGVPPRKGKLRVTLEILEQKDSE